MPLDSNMDSTIRAIAHPQRWPVYESAAAERAAALIRDGVSFDYAYGPELADLERVFSELHGGRHALALNSGTSALLAAYLALGLGPGDEVVVPTFTFLATASPLFLLGAVPVLADSGGVDGNVTAATIEAAITPQTRAVAVTHLYGHPCPMDDIVQLCRRRGLSLVEDCSHAHGSHVDGRSVGTFGDIAVYSIGGLKLVSGGMGGIMLAHDSAHYDLACLLSSFKQRSEMTVRDPRLRRLADVGLGGNLRISPPAAVLAHSHVDRLADLVEYKRRNAERLVQSLCAHPGVGRTPVPVGAGRGGWYDVVVSVDPVQAGFTRDELVLALRDEGVLASVPATRPLHLSSIFSGSWPSGWRAYPPQVLRRRFRYRPQELPHSVRLHDRWVSLPGPYLNDRAGAIVEPYRAAFERAYERLATRRRPPVATGTGGRVA